jgi:glycosyltransferase involved in cell wall biosynthesis
MKVIVVIPCHNQQEIVNFCIECLKKQTLVPDTILVVNDHSFLSLKKKTKERGIVKVVDSPRKGRVYTRNFGIECALELDADVILFLDGDCIPEDKHFVKNYVRHLKQPGMALFGMRKHIPKPKYLHEFNFDLDYEEKPVKRFPSDLLTANLDKKRRFNNEDLRIVSGAFNVFNKAKTKTEKLNLLATGMATWSCNFCLTKESVVQLKAYRKKRYSSSDCFDTKLFGDVWGGEDNVFGMDLLASGCNIKLTKDSRVLHFMHDRSDELFNHVQINNILMNRYFEVRNIIGI